MLLTPNIGTIFKFWPSYSKCRTSRSNVSSVQKSYEIQTNHLLTSMGYSIVGILVSGMLISIAELRYVSCLASDRPVHNAVTVLSFHSAEELFDMQNIYSIRPFLSPRDGTLHTRTLSQ